jgi:hypothetical protein
MEIVDLVRPLWQDYYTILIFTLENPGPRVTAKARKNENENKMEMPASDEFRKPKEDLKCHDHSRGKENHWWYVSASGDHVRLTIAQLTLWGRKTMRFEHCCDFCFTYDVCSQHNNEADYIIPPNCLGLDHLRKKPHKLSLSAGTSSSAPPIHIHFPNKLPLRSHQLRGLQQ